MVSQSEPQNRPLIGLFWMLVTGGCFVAVTAIVKHVGNGVPAPEAAFLRYLLGVVFLVPMLRSIIRAQLTRQAWGLFLFRGAAHSGAVILWFFAMANLPIAEVTALNYMSPIYVTLGAALFLGEPLALRRIVAVAVAFLGALVILRPGMRAVEPAHLAMLVAAVLFGASYLIARRMTKETSAIVIVAMLSLIVPFGLAPMAIAVWVPPTIEQLAWLFLVAGFATAGHYSMTLALGAAPIAVTQPVSFLQLVWASLLGWLVFDEALDAFVVVGGAIILGSITFIMLREAAMQRRVRTPPAPLSRE